MSLQNTDPTQTQAWKKLTLHYNTSKNFHLKELFAADKDRADKFSIKWNDFLFDFSKNRITKDTISILLELADEVNLKDAIKKYFSGEAINQTENRAVLHTALRAKKTESVLVDGVDVVPEVYQVKEHIRSFTNAIISGSKKGFSGKAFTDVVNIGIGGSDLGPAMVVEALKH